MVGRGVVDDVATSAARYQRHIRPYVHFCIALRELTTSGSREVPGAAAAAARTLEVALEDWDFGNRDATMKSDGIDVSVGGTDGAGDEMGGVSVGARGATRGEDGVMRGTGWRR